MVRIRFPPAGSHANQLIRPPAAAPAGRQLNVVAELGTASAIDPATFNGMITGDRITARDLDKSGLHFHPNRIPAIYARGEFGAVGGLITYGPSLAAAHRAAKILKSRRAPPGRGAITF